MPRTSFTLRTDTPAGGSYLRSTGHVTPTPALIVYDTSRGAVSDGGIIPNYGTGGSAFDLIATGGGGYYPPILDDPITSWDSWGGQPGAAPWTFIEVLGTNPDSSYGGGDVYHQTWLLFSNFDSSKTFYITPDDDDDGDYEVRVLGTPGVDDFSNGTSTAGSPLGVRIVDYDPVSGICRMFENGVLASTTTFTNNTVASMASDFPSDGSISGAWEWTGYSGDPTLPWGGAGFIAITRSILTDAERASWLDYLATNHLFTANWQSPLRGNGVQLAPSTSVGTVDNTFSAVPVSYGVVQLGWTATLGTALSVPVPTAALVVYSSTGIPQTVGSGTTLYEGSTLRTLTHSGITEGQWAYYSLFLHYQSTGADNYYEKAAELEVLVPKDYGSVLRLWEQIPAFYRTLDTAQGSYATDATLGISALLHFGYGIEDGIVVTAGDRIGPLFKFLSLIGFDMDYMRTLIDYIMVSKDPEIANTETLDALSSMLGVPIFTDYLGGTRLRSVLDSVGILRRSKGTLSGIRTFANALAGSNVYLDASTHYFSVNSQRANYITVPKTGAGIVEWRVAHGDEVLDPLPFSYAGYVLFSSDVSHSGTSWSLVPNAHGIVGALIRFTDLVPVVTNDFISFSVQKELNCDCIQWARLSDASGNVVGISHAVSLINGFPYVEIPVTDNAFSTEFTNCTLDFMVDLSSSTFVGGNYLVEANYVGEYFDGDTIRGGWLTSSPSSSDYRWLGSADNSWSVYAEDYTRTAAAVRTLVPTVLPITEELKYSIIEYNGVRGFPRHTIPLGIELESGSGRILTESGDSIILYNTIGL